MNYDWLEDGRKIPDDVMYYIRAMAVNAIRVLGHSPEVIAKTFNFNRACIYRWLRQYDAGGFAALASVKPPGAAPLITPDLDEWLKQTLLNYTPTEFGYDTPLWTCDIVAAVLQDAFEITVSASTIRLHLKRLGLTPQTPKYQDSARDEQEIEAFLKVKFPKIQKLAAKLGADIGFQDESGVGVMTHHGKTWGLRGKTPVIHASTARGGYNVLSIITPVGELRYSLKESSINGAVFIDFLQSIIRHRQRPLILLVDHASFHGSRLVRDFVRAHRAQLRIFFLPKRAPELNPDEQVWNEIKNNRIGKQPVKDKKDLKKRLRAALRSLQKNTKRVVSFFHLPDTKYAAETLLCES